MISWARIWSTRSKILTRTALFCVLFFPHAARAEEPYRVLYLGPSLGAGERPPAVERLEQSLRVRAGMARSTQVQAAAGVLSATEANGELGAELARGHYDLVLLFLRNEASVPRDWRHGAEGIFLGEFRRGLEAWGETPQRLFRDIQAPTVSLVLRMQERAKAAGANFLCILDGSEVIFEKRDLPMPARWFGTRINLPRDSLYLNLLRQKAPVLSLNFLETLLHDPIRAVPRERGFELSPEAALLFGRLVSLELAGYLRGPSAH